MGRSLVIVSVLVCLVALLCSLIVFDSPQQLTTVLPGPAVKVLSQARSFLSNVLATVKDRILTDSAKDKVFTKEELSRFKGQNNGPVYLAILGKVYDVSRGRKHYGPGGGYEFFAGIDGSRGFVTGQFDEGGLVDDISGLSNSDILGLDNWQSFYEKDYRYVGKVIGSFYDENGKELPMFAEYRKRLGDAHKEKDLLENDYRLFPPCNSEWRQGGPLRVWCTSLSGGTQRDWVGVPRKYYKAGSQKPRCACVRTTGPPSYDLDAKNHNNRGDLDNPHLNGYPDCDQWSESCIVPQS